MFSKCRYRVFLLYWWIVIVSSLITIVTFSKTSLKARNTSLKMYLLWHWLQHHFLKNVTKSLVFSDASKKHHYIPLIAADLKMSLKKTPPKPKFLVVSPSCS